MSVERGAASALHTHRLWEAKKWRRRRASIAWLTQLGIGAFVLALAAVATSRALAHRERAMLDEEMTSRRLVTYALTPGATLRVPIEPGTDVVRVVVHAFTRGLLSNARHRTVWRIAGSVPLELSAPGSGDRVKAEESGLAVGDPVAFNIDVSAQAPELSLKLQSVSDADGVLVRLYRRDVLQDADALRRRASLSLAKREHLASRAGELDWIDLAATDRATLVGARWQKLAPLPPPDRHFLPAIISLSRAVATVSAPLAEVGSMPVVKGELIAGVATGPNRLVIRAGDPKIQLSLHGRSAGSAEQNVSGVGQLDLAIARGSNLQFEVMADEPTSVSIAAAESRRVQLSTEVEYDRITPGRPLIIRSGDAPLVLRASVRRRVSKRDQNPADLRLLVDSVQGDRTTTNEVDATLQLAPLDRYEDGAEWVPSEGSTIYVLVPMRGVVVLRVASGEADLTLAELDPRSIQRRFVARRPSNWPIFSGEAHGTLHIAHRPVRSVEPDPNPPAAVRVRRPRVAGLLRHDQRVFVPCSTRIPFDVPAGAPHRLFVHLVGEQSTDIIVLVDDGKPRRRVSGLATSITSGRIVHVEGEAKFTLPLGDDLAPGPHVVSFDTRAACSVHLPWVKESSAPREAAWVAGDFEP